MGTDCTLHAMDQYDFNKPINVTIIYEGDDARTDLRDTLTPKIQEKIAENTSFADYSSASTSKPYEQPSLPIIDIDASTPINMNNEICYLKEISRIAQVTEKSIEAPSDKYSHQHNLKESLHNSSSFNVNENVRAKDTNNTIPNNDKIKENGMSSDINNLLTSVSDNILNILKAYRYCKLIQNDRSSTRAAIENSVNQYLSLKSYFFKLSYSTLLMLFLPEYKNVKFEEMFLLNTVRMARSKGFYCTFHELKHIYSEMMYRLILNKEKLNGIPVHNTCESNHRQDQRKPQNSNKDSRLVRKRTAPPAYRDPKLRNIFSSGPPGREVQINVNQSLLQSLPNVSKTGNSENPMHNNRNVYAASQCENPSNVNSYSYFPTLINQLSSSMPIDNDNFLQNDTNTTLVNNQYPPQQQSGMSPWPPAHSTNRTVPENYNIRITNVRTERPIQTYSKKYRRESTTDQTNIRSSVSRDSGIMSPSNFNPTTEQTYDTSAENIHLLESQLTASLPDTTSLNPNGTLIGTSVCHTCGIYTNTMCRRCYKTYYCSLLCRTIDWTNHIYICVNNNIIASI